MEGKNGHGRRVCLGRSPVDSEACPRYPLKDEEGKIKYVAPWPQVSIANKLAQQLTRLEQEFGLTPSARARLQLSPAKKEPTAHDKGRFFKLG